MFVKEGKLSRQMGSVVTALITPSQCKKNSFSKPKSGEQFVLLNAVLMKGY
jgi:hypothetical protein